jgi:hypothetical protein
MPACWRSLRPCLAPPSTHRRRGPIVLEALRAQRKCTGPVASSSDLPTDSRRSDNHSESHQPQTLRTRCIAHTRGADTSGQGCGEQELPHFARSCAGGLGLVSLLLAATPSARSTTKCTEPVTPSSGFPTDLRRSGNHSENHQPRTLRTRCIAHTRALPRRRQARQEDTSRKLRFFLFATVTLRPPPHALSASEEEKGRARGPGRGKNSPSRERFRPPSRRTFRFRVVLVGGLRPTGAPCSAQAETYGRRRVRSRGPSDETCRNLRASGTHASAGLPV